MRKCSLKLCEALSYVLGGFAWAHRSDWASHESVNLVLSGETRACDAIISADVGILSSLITTPWFLALFARNKIMSRSPPNQVGLETCLILESCICCALMASISLCIR